MSFKKLFTLFCAMLLSLTIIPLNGVSTLSAKATTQAIWPVEADFDEISTFFDPNRNTGGVYGGHNGIDIPADFHTDIYAVADGICEVAVWTNDYGNFIVLWHENLGVYTFYAHCSAINIAKGQTVSAGDIIGLVGNTGNSYGNHLHFGICDTLIGIYPTSTYYDPMTFFTYEKVNAPESLPAPTPVTTQPVITITTIPATTTITTTTNTQPVTAPPATTTKIPVTSIVTTNKPVVESCNCSEEYAGIYTTKDITTYLNIRSGHSADSDVVGKIYPNCRFDVIKADGKWAHIKFGNITGFCSMEYIQPVENTAPVTESKMTLSNVVIPTYELPYGKPADVGGVINSNLPITRFTGGIYKADRVTPEYEIVKYPNSRTYSLAGEFDESMLFDKLEAGTYFYKIEAEDTSGKVYSLINVGFKIVKENQKVENGDINGDGEVTISDGVLLQRYILGIENLSEAQLEYADMNGDSCVDIFDMIMLKEMLSI